MCIVSWRQSPQHNYHYEQTSKVEDCQTSFDQRQLPSNERVEQNAECHHSNRQECSVPSLRCVVVVVQRD